MIGRTAEAVAVSEQAYDDHLALGDELAIASPGTHRVNLLFALVQAGRLGEAEARGRAWFEVAARARMPLGVIWLGVHLARCALAQGRPATALRMERLGRAPPSTPPASRGCGRRRTRSRPSPTAFSATPPPARREPTRSMR